MGVSSWLDFGRNYHGVHAVRQFPLTSHNVSIASCIWLKLTEVMQRTRIIRVFCFVGDDMRMFPKAGFKPEPRDLFEVLHALPEREMCQQLGVSQWQFRGWLDGTEPVPLIVYKFAQVIAGHTLPSSFGEFAGCRYQNGRLIAPERAGKGAGIAFFELMSIEQIRRALVDLEGIEAYNRRLLKERNFYKGQLQRESRFGLVVNDLFNH